MQRLGKLWYVCAKYLNIICRFKFSFFLFLEKRFKFSFVCFVRAKIRAIIENQSPAERVCSQGSIYWSHNDACAQMLGWKHSGRVRGVGLGPTPGKSATYSSKQGSISSAPTPREIEMAAEIERLRTLCEEQNTKYAAQQEELASVKRMVAMIMVGKQHQWKQPRR
jgi:hypothetical protein